jgi:hypothetical protein
MAGRRKEAPYMARREQKTIDDVMQRRLVKQFERRLEVRDRLIELVVSALVVGAGLWMLASGVTFGGPL